MKRTKRSVNRLWAVLSVFTLLIGMVWNGASACTTVAVSKGASADGSVMTSQTADAGPEEFRVQIVPAADYEEGATRPVYLDPTLRAPEDPAFEEHILKGEIPQVPHTYSYIYALYGTQNEKQLSIGESTIWNGEREGLQDPEGWFNIIELSRVALERCTTAREAVKLMGEMAETYGYCDWGESLDVGDPKEVWHFEIYGAGPLSGSAVWAAQRVPEGEVAVCANRARIDVIDFDDPDHFMWGTKTTELAKEKGWWDGEGPFSFCDIYCPDNGNYYSSRREWRALSMLAPSLNLDPWARKFPFSVKPDKPVEIEDIFTIFRDHYEGTEFDLTKGMAAGPFGTPDRWAPGRKVKGAWERAIAIYRACYTYVTQSRDWLPDEVGGITWFGWDVAQTSAYMPLYGASSKLPDSFNIGWGGEFNRKSAYWAFNLVSNYANLRYDAMIEDIKEKYMQVESMERLVQPVIEARAAELAKEDPAKAVAFLTDYQVSNANSVINQWWELSELLFGKYNDGYRNDRKNAETLGYPEWWLNEVGYGPIEKK